MDQSNEKPHELSGCLARMLWMAVGNLILVLAAIFIAQDHVGFTLTATDAVFWATALCLPIVRFVDIRFLNGKTSDSQPATMDHWVRYTAAVLGTSLAIWLIVHSLPYKH
jgi:hypothetical protein